MHDISAQWTEISKMTKQTRNLSIKQSYRHAYPHHNPGP